MGLISLPSALGLGVPISGQDVGLGDGRGLAGA